MKTTVGLYRQYNKSVYAELVYFFSSGNSRKCSKGAGAFISISSRRKATQIFPKRPEIEMFDFPLKILINNASIKLVKQLTTVRTYLFISVLSVLYEKSFFT